MSLRRKILIAAGIVLGLAILVPVIHHYQLRAATEAYIAQLKAEGEPMELAQVIPPPVPPDISGAEIFRQAAALIDVDRSLLQTNGVYGMKMVAPDKAIIHWQQPNVRYIYGTNSWKDLETAVAENEKSFVLLRQIIAKPNFDFGIQYEDWPTDPYFTDVFLTESRTAALRLEMAAFCELHRGDTVSGVENLRAMLALVEAMRNERLMIPQLARAWMADIAFGVNWEILQSTNLTDGQLAELQGRWMAMDFIRSGENAAAMERVIRLIAVNQWRKSGSALRQILEDSTDWGIGNTAPAFGKFQIATKVFMWRNWWSYPDELGMLKGYQIILETTRVAYTNYSLLTAFNDQRSELEIAEVNKFGSWWNAWEILIDHDFDMHRLFSSGAASWHYAFLRAIKAETTKQMTIAAIALKRYQLKYGNCPPDLKSLVPEFVPKVPLDPVDGQPLRYRRNPNGTFLLYSVGENGKDDGGNPALKENARFPDRYYYWQNPDALDWVWPQTATEAEIQNYYAHPPK